MSAAHMDEPRPLPSLEEPAQVQLSVVVPMYNEEQRLESMLDDALDWLESVRLASSFGRGRRESLYSDYAFA